MSTIAPSTPPADLPLPDRAGSLAVTGRLARLLADRTVSDRGAWLLPVSALALVSALTLTVMGGLIWFWRAEGQLAMFYQGLAGVAGILLLIPLATLAGAAARLAATRRDTRLSSLRLLGATTATVRLLTLIETAVTALAGTLVGVIGYALLMPLFGQLSFMGGTIGATGLWIGAGPLVGAVLAIVALTTISAAIGLRKVEISPLGVRMRTDAPRMHWLRLALGFGAIVAAFGLSVATQVLNAEVGVIIVMMLVAFAVPMLAINLLGPFVVATAARIDARRARTATNLLAARTVLDNPKQAWRQVGGLALVSFVAVFMGVGLAFASGQTDDPETMMIFADIRTGVLLTLALAFVSTACSVGITQAAAILDRRSLFVGLDMIGMPVGAIDRARRRAVLRPLLLVVGIATGAALLVVAPVAGAARITDLMALATVAGVLIAGIAMVAASLGLTRLTLRSVLQDGTARAE